MKSPAQGAARGLGLAAFCLYALWAPGGLYWLDSGELGAAAAGLGVPHATGFPLFVVLGKVATWFPIGEVAFRLNLLSALCAAASVSIVVRLSLELAGDPEGRSAPALLGALTAGAGLAVGLLFCRQATVTEVYAPTALLMAATLLAMQRVAAGGGARAGLSLAVLCGLGLGLHGSFRLLFAVPVIALCFRRLRSGARWPLHAPLLCAVVFAGLHALLPLRSSSGPGLLDWGHPRTLETLWNHVSAAGIRGVYGGEMLSSESAVYGAELARLVSLLLDSLGPLALIAAAAGAISLWRRRSSRWLAFALTVVAAGDLLYAVWLNPMGNVDLQNGVPLSLAVAVFAGAGVRDLCAMVPRGSVAVGAAALVLLCAGPMWLAADVVPAARTGDLPRRYAEAFLQSAPPRAVVLTRSDSASAGALFLTTAEGARPDVAPLVRQLLPDRERTAAALARPIDRVPDIRRGGELAAVLALGLPVVWELGDDPMPPGSSPVLRGVSAGIGVAGESPQTVTRNAARLLAGPGGRDPVARRTGAHLFSNLGRLALGGGDLAGAERLFERALELRSDHGEALVNLGAVRSRRGDFAGALAVTERAIAHEPRRLRARINAARYQIVLGDRDGARDNLEHALRIEPESADALAVLGIMDAQDGDHERARERLQRAIEIEPGHAEAREALGQLDR